jgi:predicted nucleotidyltransferase component of viral defense system
MRSCGLNDEQERQLREVQAYFRLPSIGLVEKDLEVVRAIAAMAALDVSPFTLVFGGGTALARAHKIVGRMSEDVDFKIVPKAAAPITRSGLRRALAKLRGQVRDALHEAGFIFDAADRQAERSRNEDRYTVWHLPYSSSSGVGLGLRSEIQLEMTYAPLRLPAVTLPVSSFVTEANKLPPDIASISCVGLNETAAEKLIALTRRTAMDLAGLTRGEADPALVRHIYDLHAMRDLVDAATVASLATDIAAADAIEFKNQYPAYAADTAGETRKALDALQTDPKHRRRYDDFVSAMVYGEKPSFKQAFDSVVSLAWLIFQNGEGAHVG